MKYKRLFFQFLFFLFVFGFFSCSKDSTSEDPITIVTISASNFSISIQENPSEGHLIGSIAATANQGSVSFTLLEQDPSDAFSVDAHSGAIIVSDSFLFNFELHPVLSGSVKVQNGEVFKNVSVTINLIDVLETIVNIPDIHFKYALVNYNVVDLNGDGLGDIPVDLNNDLEIQVSEAELVPNLLLDDLTNIESLRGIESFTSLLALFCRDTNIINVDGDLRYNGALEVLSCGRIQDPSLDFSKNTNLRELGCGGYDEFKNIDISQNLKLKELGISGHGLSGLDVSQNINLIQLGISNVYLSNIDVSHNPNLELIAIGNTIFESIDISQNQNIQRLYCNTNYRLTEIIFTQHPYLEIISSTHTRITNLDLSQIPNLRSLYVEHTLLTDLDVSQNPNLTYLNCSYNPLTSLNVQNGNNTVLYYLQANNNPDLTCIQVDDVIYANNQPDWHKDINADYSEECL